jgi:ATP/maltotriose-dependent transcriptional regulator MalT
VLRKLRPIQATVLAAEGRLDEADAVLERALPGLLVATDPREKASPLMFAARVALYRGDVERAAELLDEVEQLLESLPAPSRLTEHSLRRVRRRLAGLPPFLVG